mmetsp:Transcript_20669/g.30799  ORF Transcript_20669/g.30799 Transcript_20669/m.30799 type:complete len:225 (+) Transcript_20669:626-1300(+)
MVLSHSVVPIAESQLSARAVASGDLTRCRVLHPQVHTGTSLSQVFSGRALIVVQMGAIDHLARLGSSSAITLQLQLERQGEAIHQAHIQPIAACGLATAGVAWEAHLSESSFEFSINWRGTALSTAYLAGSTAATNRALVPLAIAAHFGPVSSGLQVVGHSEVMGCIWRQLDVLRVGAHARSSLMSDPNRSRATTVDDAQTGCLRFGSQCLSNEGSSSGKCPQS